MTQQHFDPSELGRDDPELERMAARLQAHASGVDDSPPADLAARIAAAVESEPMPLGWRARAAALLGSFRGATRALAATVVIGAAVVAAIAFATLTDAARDRVGTSPSPSTEVAPTTDESPAPTLTPSPSVTPPVSPSPTPSLVPTQAPTTAPTPTDDDEPETPRASPSDDDEEEDDGETPEPSETDDDSSGPGG